MRSGWLPQIEQWHAENCPNSILQRGKHDLVGLKLSWPEAVAFIEARMNKTITVNGCTGPVTTFIVVRCSSEGRWGEAKSEHVRCCACSGVGVFAHLLGASAAPAVMEPRPRCTLLPLLRTLSPKCGPQEPFVPHQEEYYLCIQVRGAGDCCCICSCLRLDTKGHRLDGSP